MNRRKKINQLLKAHAKKASAKLAPKSKPKYICKADRLKLEQEAAQADAANLGAEPTAAPQPSNEP
jgi:hypothetical protein